MPFLGKRVGHFSGKALPLAGGMRQNSGGAPLMKKGREDRKMYDLLIKNGTVVDGTGAKRRVADVAVEGDRIVKIAPSISDPAKKTINAEGLFVTPGFIDVHSHADLLAVVPNDSQNFLRQGITTQFMGQCGASPAPFDEMTQRRAKKTMAPDEFEVYKAKLATPASFMKSAAEMPYSLNTAFLIGHKAIRVKTLGYSDAAPDDAQMTEMKATLTEAMEAGYFGYCHRKRRGHGGSRCHDRRPSWPSSQASAVRGGDVGRL